MSRRLHANAARLLGRWHLHPAPRRSTSRDRLRTAGWGWRHNVVGVGVSSKVAGGRRGRRPTVTFYVKRKMAPSRLRRSELIPEQLALDANAGAPIDTDVVEVGDGFSLHGPDDVVDPLRPGASLGHFRGISGTLGIFVIQSARPGLLMLGCSHVLAKSGDARADDPIEQPLVLDDDLDRVVATLASGFTVLDSASINEEDFALGQVAVPSEPTPIGAGTPVTGVSRLAADQFEEGTPTILRGAFSNGAEGVVLGSDNTFVLNGFTFAGLVLYRSSCRAGDSGGAVVSADDSTLLGIHIGGNTAKRRGLFFPAGPIFARHRLMLA